jgi:hypothetical protein
VSGILVANVGCFGRHCRVPIPDILSGVGLVEPIEFWNVPIARAVNLAGKPQAIIFHSPGEQLCGALDALDAATGALSDSLLRRPGVASPRVQVIRNLIADALCGARQSPVVQYGVTQLPLKASKFSRVS